MTRKLTIRDIAQLAGVSIATVSRVLNHKPDVDPQTRERILQIVDAHRFAPDLSAVQLAGSSSRSPSRRRLSSPHTFPADFLWGAATSAYQIEGATQEDGRAPSIWDTFVREPGATRRGETGDIATDHYHQMQHDVALMAELNLKAYRFSVAWPRILPQGTGPINVRGLDFYDRMVDTLLTYQILPVVTLYHWDLPLALHERGGWLTRETAYAFADYAEIVARRLGDRVSWWITQNEPWCSAYLGYGIGAHAPGLHDLSSAVTAAHHLLLSHGLAAARIHSHAPTTPNIGIALNLTPIYAADESEATQQGIERLDVLHNRWFLDPLFHGTYPEQLFSNLKVEPPHIEQEDMDIISTPLDFLGVNYYSRSLIRTPLRLGMQQQTTPPYELVVPVPEASYTQMAWEIYPQGLTDVLLRVHRNYAPPCILITENGAAFEDVWDGREHVPDKRRVHYLREHLQALETTLKQGVPIRGYFSWSLLDNFEWTDGYSKRFGLIYVDFATQRRIIKESGRWYAAFIQEVTANTD
jgi:beta-glucosidase